MAILNELAGLALGMVLDGANKTLSDKLGPGGASRLVGFLTERFVDQGRPLIAALEGANARAWRALEIALAGDSWWRRLANKAEDRSFAEQVRRFLDDPRVRADAPDRAACLKELRAARASGLLTQGQLRAEALAERVGHLARHSDPEALVVAQVTAVRGLANALRVAGHPGLADLLDLRPRPDESVLVIAVRYFFRRAVEDNPRLAQGLTFARLERLQRTNEEGWAALNRALSDHGDRLDTLLADVREKVGQVHEQVVETHGEVVQTHEAVLDVQAELARQGEHNRELYQAVMSLQQKLDLAPREVRPRDSLSIRSDAERQIVRQLVARYRALPENQRDQLPALLNAIGMLELASGNFDEAQKDFAEVAELVADDPSAHGEAHMNAYRTALERRDWPGAFRELTEALNLDGRRFAPFPVSKYRPKRILGAGGFGVAFLCTHKDLAADVVVKTLAGDELDRAVDTVLDEARILYLLDHPGIIRLLDCGYVEPEAKSRPYFVMQFFEGVTLEEHVEAHGPLSVPDLLAVARQIADGLRTAHGKGVLHRDVKPSNILVRPPSPPAPLPRSGERGEKPLTPPLPASWGRGPGGEGDQWHVKLIDFGLALQQSVLKASASSRTIRGSTIAGTVDYAAPEQLGKLPAAVGPASDVYGFARTCCYALFQTPYPLGTHWRELPAALSDLLEQCLADQPSRRLPDFPAVLQRLGGIGVPQAPSSERPAAPAFSPLPASGRGVGGEGSSAQAVSGQPVLRTPDPRPLFPRRGEGGQTPPPLLRPRRPHVEEPPEIEAIEVPPLADDIPVVEPLPERVPARGRRHEEPPTVPVVGEAPPPRNLPREAMLRLLAKHFAGAPNVFIMPLIPEKKLRNVRDQYRPLLPPDNEPLLLYDGTLLGHARDGFCFFDSGLGWKGGMAGVGFLAYGSLDPRQVKGDERIFASGLVLSAKAKASVLYQDVAKIVPAVRAALAEIRSLLASQPGA